MQNVTDPTNIMELKIMKPNEIISFLQKINLCRRVHLLRMPDK